VLLFGAWLSGAGGENRALVISLEGFLNTNDINVWVDTFPFRTSADQTRFPQLVDQKRPQRFMSRRFQRPGHCPALNRRGKTINLNFRLSKNPIFFSEAGLPLIEPTCRKPHQVVECWASARSRGSRDMIEAISTKPGPRIA
jgi:hypothetical protein